MLITLIGFRGTGKSSVAPELAGRLGWEFIDSDEEIMARAGKTVSEIFAEEGEPVFRQYEASVMAELLARKNLVLSAGGGAVLDPGTRAAMRAAGPVVWLKASVSTIFSRIGQDLEASLTRPALTEFDPKTEVAVLLSRREPVYDDAATVIVETDGRTIVGVVDDILQQLPADWENAT